MNRFRTRVTDLFRRTLVLRPKERIVDWARKWIHLSSSESGDFPGQYDPDLNPLPVILFDLYESGEYDEVIIKKSSQSGFTLACFILICWFVTFVRRNFLYVIDSEEEVEKISSERLQPLLQDCGPARKRIRSGTSPFTRVLLRFQGLTGYLSGGKSLGKVSNKSVGLAIVDEISALEKTLSAAAVRKNLGEIRSRLKKQSTGFFISLSKPSTWEGIINQEYETGTKHRCFVPCPHCSTDAGGQLGGYQVIEWEQIKFGHCKDLTGHWDYQRIEAETFFECVHCKRAVVESEHKAWMVTHRQYRRTNFGEDPQCLPEPRRASIEVTDLTSTFPKLSWGRLAVKYVKSLNDPEALKEFFRDHLARPDKPDAVQTEESIIYKMSGGYRRGECPILPRKIVMGVDRQKDRWKWVKAAFNYEGDCWVIDWGTIINPAAITEEANKPVEIKRWPDHLSPEQRNNPVVFKGLVDERYSQADVRDFIISTLQSVGPDGTPDYRFHGCYGLARHTARSLRDIVSPSAHAKPNAMHKMYPLWSYAISTDNFNNEIHTQRFGKFKMVLAARNAGGELPPGVRRIWFPFDLTEEFVREITRERFELNPKSRRWEWADVQNNDWGDGLRMCFAVWYLLAPLEEAPPPVSAASLRNPGEVEQSKVDNEKYLTQAACAATPDAEQTRQA